MKLLLLPGESLKLTQTRFYALPYCYGIIGLALLLAPLFYFGWSTTSEALYLLWVCVVIIGTLRFIVIHFRTLLVVTDRRVVFRLAKGFLFSRTDEIELANISNISVTVSRVGMPQLEVFVIGHAEPLKLHLFDDLEKIKNLIWYLKNDKQD